MKWLFIFLIFVSPASAEVNSGSLLELIDLEKGRETQVGRVHLSGLERGIFWANIWMQQVGGGDRLYCMPSKLGMTGEQAESIFRLYVEEHPEQEEQPAGFTMLQALSEVFPCSPNN